MDYHSGSKSTRFAINFHRFSLTFRDVETGGVIRSVFGWIIGASLRFRVAMLGIATALLVFGT